MLALSDNPDFVETTPALLTPDDKHLDEMLSGPARLVQLTVYANTGPCSGDKPWSALYINGEWLGYGEVVA